MMASPISLPSPGPLEGLRVIDCATLFAGLLISTEN
jgi:hypothetical protein